MPSHTIKFQPSGAQIECRADQTLAAAAAEQGVDIYVGCENGVCLICQGERVNGEFKFRNALGQELLDKEDRILCCVAQPQSDAEIYMPSVHTADHKPTVELACQIATRTELGDNVWRFDLRAPAGKAVDFWPGQYLLLHVQDERGNVEQIPYSIANAPSSMGNADPRLIELHIANHSDNAERVVKFLQQAVIARITLPMGDCFITPRFMRAHAEKPLLMIAAGSGFSQIKSLLEAALAINPNQEIHLYWSNKQSDGFYLAELPLALAQQHPNLHYHPIIEQHSEGWSGRAGWIYQVISEDFSDLSQVQVFACGSPNMVYGTLDQLAPLGLSQTNMYSDVFSYAPRS